MLADIPKWRDGKIVDNLAGKFQDAALAKVPIWVPREGECPTGTGRHECLYVHSVHLCGPRCPGHSVHSLCLPTMSRLPSECGVCQQIFVLFVARQTQCTEHKPILLLAAVCR